MLARARRLSEKRRALALAWFPRPGTVPAEWATCRKGTQIVRQHQHDPPRPRSRPLPTPLTSALRPRHIERGRSLLLLVTTPHLRLAAAVPPANDLSDPIHTHQVTPNTPAPWPRTCHQLALPTYVPSSEYTFRSFNANMCPSCPTSGMHRETTRKH
jgi:hypothetical protein